MTQATDIKADNLLQMLERTAASDVQRRSVDTRQAGRALANLEDHRVNNVPLTKATQSYLEAFRASTGNMSVAEATRELRPPATAEAAASVPSPSSPWAPSRYGVNAFRVGRSSGSIVIGDLVTIDSEGNVTPCDRQNATGVVMDVDGGSARVLPISQSTAAETPAERIANAGMSVPPRMQPTLPDALERARMREEIQQELSSRDPVPSSHALVALMLQLAEEPEAAQSVEEESEPSLAGAEQAVPNRKRKIIRKKL